MRRGKRKSLVTLRGGTYYENFSVNGRRFRGSLETNDRDQAEILATQKRADALLGKLTGQKPEHTLSKALGRYWLEHGQRLKTHDDIQRMGLVLMAHLGKETKLSEITTGMLATYVARRRAGLSNRSVNIELQHLRAVISRAKDVWEIAIPTIKWKSLMLEEAGPREKILTEEEEGRFFTSLRPDHHPMVRFALVTGLRLDNVLALTWQQIDWDARIIEFQIKSKTGRIEKAYLPITPSMLAILGRERGRHPNLVFTYVCDRNRVDPHSGKVQKKGQRYPYTMTGWRKEWKKAIVAAALQGLRFHDLRHTAATRALRASGGDIGAVQEMLMHKDIATTRRYAKSDLRDVRAAMEAVEMTQIRHRDVAEEGETG